MGIKEIILLIAVCLFLAVAIYTISRIEKLNISKPRKTLIYYVTIIIPILGLLMVVKAANKQSV